MKQFSFFTVLFCLLASLVGAATISGVVLNGNSQPVANQIVYASDSTSNMSNPAFFQATTNAQGQFTMTVPSAVTTGSTIHVWTFACGLVYYNVHSYSGANLTSNFNICGSPASTYVLKGNITLGGAANNGIATVYLIQAAYDSMAQDWTLNAIDSIQTNSNGAYSKTYNSYPSTSGLLLKVALNTGHPQYANYLPTYYTSALNWYNATNVTVANFTNNTNTNINMIAGTNPGGPGFIGGYVLQGANKGTGVGDPLNHRLLLLTTAAGTPVAYTYTNAQGQFSFPSLAYGTYKIFGDAWGKNNPALTVTLSASQPGISNITFEENSTKFEGHIGGLSVGQLSTLPGVRLYPNPATDYVQLEGIETIQGSKSIVLTGISGAVILKQEVAAGQSVRIPTAQLAAGVYLLQVQTASGNAQFKVVK